MFFDMLTYNTIDRQEWQGIFNKVKEVNYMRQSSYSSRIEIDIILPFLRWYKKAEMSAFVLIAECSIWSNSDSEDGSWLKFL